MVTLSESGEIYRNGDIVGVLESNGNTLVDISVDEDKRNNGIATEAVSQFVERVREDGYDRVTTTAVVNPAMEVVLRRNGFESRVVELEGPQDEPLEEIRWVLEFN